MWLRHLEVLVSSSLSPFRRGLPVLRQMRRLPAKLLEEEAQDAVSLALRVCGRVGQVVAEASVGVSVVVRDAVGGGVGHVAREACLVVGLGFGPFERRHRPRWFRHRHTSALQVWLLVMWEGPRSRLVARRFRGANVEW